MNIDSIYWKAGPAVAVACPKCGATHLPETREDGMVSRITLCQPCYAGAVSSPARVAQRVTWAQVLRKPNYARFDLSKLPTASLDAAKAALAWRYRDRPSRGVGLIGRSGLGKSMIVHEVARLQWEDGCSVAVTSSTEFAWKVGDVDSQAERRRYMERCIRCDVLLLDDVGKEKLTERAESDLYHVLEQREQQLRPMIFTANRGDSLRLHFSDDRGDPILKRLARMAETKEIRA